MTQTVGLFRCEGVARNLKSFKATHNISRLKEMRKVVWPYQSMEKTFHKSCQPLMIKIKAWRTMNKRELFQSDEEHVQKPNTSTAQRSKKPDAPLPRDGKRHSAVLFPIVLARTGRRREETEWVEWEKNKTGFVCRWDFLCRKFQRTNTINPGTHKWLQKHW